MITDDFGVDPDLPVFEDPSRYTYIRPEGRGLLVGQTSRCNLHEARAKLRSCQADTAMARHCVPGKRVRTSAPRVAPLFLFHLKLRI